MNNPMLNEDIPMIGDDYNDFNDDYKTPDTTLFIEPDTTEATSTLHLRQKVKRDKIVSLYRYLGVTGDPGPVDLD